MGDSPGPALPEDFAAALEVVPEAKAQFHRLPPSHRREHLKAIEEAVKPETRRRRIDAAVDMLRTQAQDR